MTLDAATIDRVCRGDGIAAQLTRYVDEHLELCDLADDEDTGGGPERAAYYRQEAAAWRATATVLRRIAGTPAGAVRIGKIA